MPSHTINIADIIADKIKVRYAEITEATMGSKNMVVDAFYPTYVRQSLISQNPRRQPLSKKCSAISPFIANELNVYNVQIDDLTKMLGYTKKNLKDLLESLKTKHLDLALVGLGGTGMNFMHWATELANYTNSINIFQNIQIYDADTVDITNIFRFPQILNPERAYYNDTIYKIDMLPSTSILAHNIGKSSYFIEFRHLVKSDGSLYNLAKDYIFYGAPDIKTREMLHSIPGIRFISGTHGDNDCQLYIKPEQDSELQIESYGMINLSVFFMNQLRLTIEFLTLLASNKDLTQTELVFEYSFDKEYSEGNIYHGGLNRTYNFPIQRESVIDQELNALPEPVEEAVLTESEESNDAHQTLDDVPVFHPILPTPVEPLPIDWSQYIVPAPLATVPPPPPLYNHHYAAQINTNFLSAIAEHADASSSVASDTPPTLQDILDVAAMLNPSQLDILNSLVSTEPIPEPIPEPAPRPRRTRRTPAQMAEAREEEARLIAARIAEATDNNPPF
jgi:hypothetical protein